LILTNIFPFTNTWTNKINKSGVGTISLVLCRSQTKGLARIWLVLPEFAINNKVYSTTKVSPFMANYGRELRMGADIRKKEKIEKVMEFVEKSLEGGWGSIEKGIGRDEITSR